MCPARLQETCTSVFADAQSVRPRCVDGSQACVVCIVINVNWRYTKRPTDRRRDAEPGGIRYNRVGVPRVAKPHFRHEQISFSYYSNYYNYSYFNCTPENPPGLYGHVAVNAFTKVLFAISTAIRPKKKKKTKEFGRGIFITRVYVVDVF